jgi:RNA polymerase sigma-70 factor (ECF subfamily)
VDKNQWLQTLLRDHEGRLLRYARRFVGDQFAREIVQESFLRLWRETPASLEGREAEWLFCVCRNLCLDALKKEKKMSSDPLEPAEVAADQESADAKLEREQETNHITRLITELPASQREVVRLKFQEGFSYKEISSITGHSVSHVGVLIHEAMKKLKNQLASPQIATAQGGRK